MLRLEGIINFYFRRSLIMIVALIFTTNIKLSERNLQGMTQRQLFLTHIGQTSPAPLALEIVKAEGSCLWDINEKKYIDLIAGIGVCNVGHRHPRVVNAIKKQ